MERKVFIGLSCQTVRFLADCLAKRWRNRNFAAGIGVGTKHAIDLFLYPPNDTLTAAGCNLPLLTLLYTFQHLQKPTQITSHQITLYPFSSTNPTNPATKSNLSRHPNTPPGHTHNPPASTPHTIPQHPNPTSSESSLPPCTRAHHLFSTNKRTNQPWHPPSPPTTTTSTSP